MCMNERKHGCLCSWEDEDESNALKIRGSCTLAEIPYTKDHTAFSGLDCLKLIQRPLSYLLIEWIPTQSNSSSYSWSNTDLRLRTPGGEITYTFTPLPLSTYSNCNKIFPLKIGRKKSVFNIF